MTTPATFDPSRFLTLVSGKEYLEVKWRLVWLRSEHPDATIETALVTHQNSEAVFKCRVAIPDGGTATGWGSEDAQGFGDYLEKAETKAVGRALAALGYGTQFCGDFEFGASGGRVVDSPVTAPAQNGTSAPNAAQGRTSQSQPSNAPQTRTSAPSGQNVSEAQGRMLYAMLMQHNNDNKQAVYDYCDRYNVRRLDELAGGKQNVDRYRAEIESGDWRGVVQPDGGQTSTMRSQQYSEDRPIDDVPF